MAARVTVVLMPATFKLGDTAECMIDYRPAMLTWRDMTTLILDGKAQPIAVIRKDDRGQLFAFVPEGRTIRRSELVKAIADATG